MNLQRVLGIDPGLGGALALIADGYVQEVIDMPIQAKAFGSGNQVHVPKLLSVLMVVDPTFVVIERSQPMQGQGKRQSPAGAFSMGDSFGSLRACVESLTLPCVYVPATTWKTQLGLAGKRKNADAPITLATQLYPNSERWLQRKKDHDRAEAILLAHWALTCYRGPKP